MDEFKKATSRDLTAWDLNCRKHVAHTPRRNKLEQRIKRTARRRLKAATNKIGEQ